MKEASLDLMITVTLPAKASEGETSQIMGEHGPVKIRVKAPHFLVLCDGGKPSRGGGLRATREMICDGGYFEAAFSKEFGVWLVHSSIP